MATFDCSAYEESDALALAGHLEQGEVSPQELMRCAVSAAKREESLGALVYPEYESSTELTAKWRPRGRFGAVPFLLKDIIPSRRFPMSVGTGLLEGTLSQVDATLVERFEAAGLVPFARTRVPSLCMAPTTEPAHGARNTLNPWDRTRSAGGSSGGAAAAVAARIVPIAHASDGGGSIRIPAACCGVFGLKTSRGRLPLGPLRGEGWGGMSTDGVVSRSVRDTAAVLDAVAGYEPGAPYACPPGATSYLEIVRSPGSHRFKIGVWSEAFAGIGIADEPLGALCHVTELCRRLGHEVTELPLPAIDFDRFVGSHGVILATNITARVDAKLRELRRGLADEDLEPVLQDGYEIGKRLGATDYLDAIQHLHAIGRAMDQSFMECSLVLTPALTRLPVPLGEFAMTGTFWDFRQRTSRYATFLPMVNASGQPAAVLPLTWTVQGLPVATQVIGRFGREDDVLRLSAQLEALAPWADRRPQRSAAITKS